MGEILLFTVKYDSFWHFHIKKWGALFLSDFELFVLLHEFLMWKTHFTVLFKVFPCFYCKDYTAFRFLLSPAIRCNPCTLPAVVYLPHRSLVHNTSAWVLRLPSSPVHRYQDRIWYYIFTICSKWCR